MIDKEFGFSLTVFILFFLYGLSNLYILIYLRKVENYAIGLLGFLSIFLGDIKNYKRINDTFVESYTSKRKNIAFNKFIALTHLIAPFLIPISIIFWIFMIGLY